MQDVSRFSSLLWAMCLIAAASGCAATRAAPMPIFAPGQVWSINSPTQPQAKVVIGRVEAWKDKVAVHVSLIDIVIPSGAPNAGATITVGHVPFEQSALAASVDRLLARGVSPPASFDAGYREWQSAKGGIFTISVAEAIDIALETR